MRLLCSSLLLAALLPSTAGARTLYWRAIDVEARLEADGRLRISESQTMVFSGNWNGGERVFRISLGQKLDFHGMRRVDPVTGRSYAMTEGSLSDVDDYKFTDRRTLRWRSRLPSDPDFDETAITYVLEYSVSGVLRQDGDNYRLSHDFLFAEAAERLADRLDDVTRKFPLALDLGCHDGTLARVLAGRGGIETLVQCDLAPAMARANFKV